VAAGPSTARSMVEEVGTRGDAAEVGVGQWKVGGGPGRAGLGVWAAAAARAR
jgi:hypothetical protein